MAKNENCGISDSALCKWIGKDCDGCYISSLKRSEDAQKALADFQVTMSLLPDNFDDLQSDECHFCIGDKNKRDGYALIDLAHIEPPSETGMFFGFGKKIRQKIGSFMPLSISICARCRRVFRFAELMVWLFSIVFFAAAIVVVSVPSIGSRINQAVVIGIIILAILVGYVAGKIISDVYIKVKSSKVRFSVFDIPIASEMKKNGWFAIQDHGDVSRFVFTKKSHTKKVGNIRNKENDPEIDFKQTSFFED
ncbi:MAG: hypothetical protein ACOX8Q_00980 [Christensenellales bacterium]|jgi:hypothetical protein